MGEGESPPAAPSASPSSTAQPPATATTAEAATSAETPIGLIGLYVAVVSVAHSLGGAAGSLAAAVLGFAMAVVVAAAVPRAPRGVARATAATIAVAALGLAALSAFVAADRWRDGSAEDKIVGVVESGYREEVDWYKHPTEARDDRLERYFVSPSDGGERLSVIRTAIERLRHCQYRMGGEARATTFVKEIDINGDRAKVLAAESIYQPTYARVNGKWQRRQIGELFYTEDQIYVLKRADGEWKISAAPQPQSTREC